MQLESQRVGPVGLSERILFIDVLRGLALFGILAANMRGFFAPLDCSSTLGSSITAVRMFWPRASFRAWHLSSCTRIGDACYSHSPRLGGWH